MSDVASLEPVLDDVRKRLETVPTLVDLVRYVVAPALMVLGILTFLETTLQYRP